MAHKRHVEPTVEHGLDAVAFSGSEEPGVDKHAREAVADSAVDQCRRDRTVDTSREGAERALIADSRADILDGIVHERGHCPVAGATHHIEEEAAQDVAPDGRMNHLGVELYAVLVLLRILHGGNRTSGGRCGSPEAWGDRADAVSVTHPAGSLGRKAAEQRSSPIELDGRLAVLARRSVFHGPSKQHSHHWAPCRCRGLVSRP